MKLWLMNGILRKGAATLMAFGFTVEAETEDAAIGLATKRLMKNEPDYAIASIFATDISDAATKFTQNWVTPKNSKPAAGTALSTHVKASHYCNKCGFLGIPDKHGQHDRPKTGETCPYMARRLQGFTTPMSTCSSCGANYPSAPIGVVHKCGACEDGMMVRPQ